MSPDATQLKIKEWRHHRGLSQTGLAAASGLHIGTIRDVECHRRGARWDTLGKLADALGVEIHEMLHLPPD